MTPRSRPPAPHAVRSVSPGTGGSARTSHQYSIPTLCARSPKVLSSFSGLASLKTRITVRPKPAGASPTSSHTRRENTQTPASAFPGWRESSYRTGSGSGWITKPAPEVPPTCAGPRLLSGALWGPRDLCPLCKLQFLCMEPRCLGRWAESRPGTGSPLGTLGNL